MKKTVGIIFGIVGAVLTVIGIVLKINIHRKAAVNAVCIIGGADGPTSIFVAGKLGGNFSTCAVVIGIILLVIAGFIFFRNKH